jgi:hypothetical protein
MPLKICGVMQNKNESPNRTTYSLKRFNQQSFVDIPLKNNG